MIHDQWQVDFREHNLLILITQKGNDKTEVYNSWNLGE